MADSKTTLSPREQAAISRISLHVARGMARGMDDITALSHAAHHSAHDYSVFSRLCQAGCFTGTTVEELVIQYTANAKNSKDAA